MSKTQELQAQIEELTRQLNALREEERREVLADVKAKVHAFQITAEELGWSSPPRPPRPRRVDPAKSHFLVDGVVKNLGRVPTKYRDEKGNEWSGRGPHPEWFTQAIEAGATEESLLVKP